jgi:hypothetical protein
VIGEVRRSRWRRRRRQNKWEGKKRRGRRRNRQGISKKRSQNDKRTNGSLQVFSLSM